MAPPKSIVNAVAYMPGSVVPVESISERVLKHHRRQLIREFKQLLTEHAEGIIKQRVPGGRRLDSEHRHMAQSAE